MDREQQGPVSGAREVLRGLGELRFAKAPESLAGAVLAGVGLADAYWQQDTPLGPVFIAYNAWGISAVMRAEDGAELQTLFQSRFGRKTRRVAGPPRELAHAVDRLLAGDRVGELRFDLRSASEFERAVLLKAMEIPQGEVRPYSWIAREIGRPRAVRAVGSALGQNPIPLLIPCHCVVRTDGRIGEYVFGSEAKRAVLAAEGADPELIEKLARSGVRYYADDGPPGNYCFPTCGGMHRRHDPHRKSFYTAREAITQGYRPCPVCRPALAS